MAGVYVHIPFCKSFCTYCDFYSVCDEKRIGHLLGSLFREMEARSSFFSACGNITPSTLYIGGGTPSRLTAEQLGDIALRAKNTFRGGRPFVEFTVEVNPDDVSADFAAGLRGIGVTRVSMGVQSFDDAALKWMNRRHTREGAVGAYRILREAGFENVSLDLIFGYALPGESEGQGMERWRRDLAEVTALAPEHVSSYQMSIEAGSLLGEMAAKGEYREPPDAYCASQYELLQGVLAAAGYEQYEISNFALARKGGPSPYRSRHNASYWMREPYIGLGPGAHSFCGNVRSWNPPDMEGYIAAGGVPEAGSETLSAEEVMEEMVMLGLRRAEGIDLQEIPGLNRASLEPLVASGLLSPVGSRLRIPPSKWFVSDDIITDIFKNNGK